MGAGQWPKAAAAAENLVRPYYRGLGSEAKYTGIAEVQLAFCWIQDDRHYQAEKFFLQAFKALGKWADSDDTVILAQTALADSYRQQGEHAKAEPLSARALEAIEAKRGPNHADLAHPLAVRGGVLTELGRYEQAESMLQRAQSI